MGAWWTEGGFVGEETVLVVWSRSMESGEKTSRRSLLVPECVSVFFEESVSRV